MRARLSIFVAGALLLVGVVALTHDLGHERSGIRISDELPADLSPEAMAELRVPIDVNTATSAELTSLAGVGPAIAERIVAGRPYHGCADLLRVRGIGPARLRRIADRVVTCR